jgi:hypothetical protein
VGCKAATKIGGLTNSLSHGFLIHWEQVNERRLP